MGLSSRSRFVPLVPPPVRPLRRDPVSRVSRAGGRACARAFRAGAVCAPDCACARGKRRAHVSCPFLRVFSRRRETGGEAAPRMPLPPASSYHKFSRVKFYLGIISNKLRNVRPPSILRPADGREPRPPPAASGTGNGRRLHRSDGCSSPRNAVRSDRIRLWRDSIRSNRPPFGEKPSDGQTEERDS